MLSSRLSSRSSIPFLSSSRQRFVNKSSANSCSFLTNQIMNVCNSPSNQTTVNAVDYSSMSTSKNWYVSSSSNSFFIRPTQTLLQAASDNNNNDNSPHSDEPKKQENFAVPSWTDPSARNLYTRLGLRSSASTLDIKKHYRHLAKQYHPDSNPGDKTAEEKFRNVKEAYETLSNTDKRRVYDSTGASASQQEQAGFGGGGGASYRSYSWSGSGLHGKYNVHFDENGKPVFQVSRWVWLIFFFSVGMFISAFRELRTRRKGKEVPDDASREHELGVQRSALWRPFISILLFITFLPRIPACIVTWYFYVYRPTIQAEDRATMDNVTIIMKDEFDGAAVKMSLVSPFLDQAVKKVNAKTKDAEDYIMTVTLRPFVNNATATGTQAPELQNSSANDGATNLPTVEYPCGSLNFFSMSFPRPRSADGKTILPCNATIRVKTAIKDGPDQRVNLEKGKTIFERQMTIM